MTLILPDNLTAFERACRSTKLNADPGQRSPREHKRNLEEEPRPRWRHELPVFAYD